MTKNIVFAMLFLCCLAAILVAGGGNKDKVKDNLMEVSGRVRLVGNEPFTELVISGADKEWYIEREEAYKLKDLQHRTVTVEGEETVIERRFANGEIAGIRRELRNIKVISVE